MLIIIFILMIFTVFLSCLPDKIKMENVLTGTVTEIMHEGIMMYCEENPDKCYYICTMNETIYKRISLNSLKAGDTISIEHTGNTFGTNPTQVYCKTIW